MTRRAIVDAPGLGKALGPYSRAVWAGNILYLAGQLGIDPATNKLVEGGAGPETEQLMKGIVAVSWRGRPQHGGRYQGECLSDRHH